MLLLFRKYIVHECHFHNRFCAVAVVNLNEMFPDTHQRWCMPRTFIATTMKSIISLRGWPIQISEPCFPRQFVKVRAHRYAMWRLPTSAMSSADDDDYNSAILTGPILPWLSRLQNEGSSHGSLNCLLLLLLFSICADQPAALYHNLPQIAKRSGWPFNCWKVLLISTLRNRRLTGKRTGYE